MPATNSLPSDDATVVVFERDLRLADHEALAQAAANGAVLPLFVLDEPLRAALGSAQKWWLHHSLAALDAGLADAGNRLVLASGADRAATVIALCLAAGIRRVAWTARHGVFGRMNDHELAAALKSAGLACSIHPGQLLHDPARVRTGGGNAFRVYSPFWRAISDDPFPKSTLPAPEQIAALEGVNSETLDDWRLLPRDPDWAGGIAAEWCPGEAGAHERLRDFLDGPILGYAGDRDRPDRLSTSRLSPHLAFGEISPRQIVAAVARTTRGAPADREKFLKELAWREFAYHLLAQAPDLATRNFNPAFDAFAWRDDDANFAAWSCGMTGYPIVDAGMRELWQTGWMHNRVRMIAASFLSKHLLIDWRRGERWFRDTLVDADPANNAASWQWVAGSGADAAPYFRIFNPVLQGEKFDPDGAYVRRFVPELANMPVRWLHKPWQAPHDVLREAGVTLGRTYPHPVVDHARARERALSAFQSLRGSVD